MKYLSIPPLGGGAAAQSSRRSAELLGDVRRSATIRGRVSPRGTPGDLLHPQPPAGRDQPPGQEGHYQ